MAGKFYIVLLCSMMAKGIRS